MQTLTESVYLPRNVKSFIFGRQTNIFIWSIFSKTAKANRPSFMRPRTFFFKVPKEKIYKEKCQISKLYVIWLKFQRNLQNQLFLLILCMKGSFYRHKPIDIMDCSSINGWLLRRLHVDYDRRENSTWVWSKTVLCSRNTWIMYLPCG